MIIINIQSVLMTAILILGMVSIVYLWIETVRLGGRGQIFLMIVFTLTFILIVAAHCLNY